MKRALPGRQLTTKVFRVHQQKRSLAGFKFKKEKEKRTKHTRDNKKGKKHRLPPAKRLFNVASLTIRPQGAYSKSIVWRSGTAPSS